MINLIVLKRTFQLQKKILIINLFFAPFILFLSNDVLILASPIIILYVIFECWFLFFKLVCPKCNSKLFFQDSYVGGSPILPIFNKGLPFSPDVCKNCGFPLKDKLASSKVSEN